jgi:hypothetical protein
MGKHCSLRRCGVTYNHHFDDSRGSIYDQNIFIIQTTGVRISSWTRTLNLWVKRQVFYHNAATSGQELWYCLLTITISCWIFEHFATLTDIVTEFIKLRFALHRQGAILAPKQVDLLSILKMWLHPFYLESIFSQTLIRQTVSGSTQYLYYINMLFILK